MSDRAKIRHRYAIAEERAEMPIITWEQIPDYESICLIYRFEPPSTEVYWNGITYRLIEED